MISSPDQELPKEVLSPVFNLPAQSDEDRQRRVMQVLAEALRDRMMACEPSVEKHARGTVRTVVNYLSMEFLIGRGLHNAILNLDMEDSIRRQMADAVCELEEIENQEADAGLGNGGLGRLAACFLDSCATLDIPVVGYGIRYRFGIFRQAIENGRQVEYPDDWLVHGNPWEIKKRAESRNVCFGGHCEHVPDGQGSFKVIWHAAETVRAIPHDMPIPGYRNGVVNTLRLWRAEAIDGFDLDRFNHGEYLRAMAKSVDAERLSLVLYPDDSTPEGRELRLRQQYFMVSASLQDVVARWVARQGEDFSGFAKGNVFQLNDTHPTVAIPELMRLLVDQYEMSWDQAWAVTSQCMAYTNHTLLPEALETWPLALFDHVIPRIAEIVREIDRRWIQRLREHAVTERHQLERMAIIGYEPYQIVRMANLGVVGSYSVNGVAALHTQLLKEGLFADFYSLYPNRFNNKTNGVTPRRWLAHANPGLRDLLTSAVGEGWQADLDQLTKLQALADDSVFVERFMGIKAANKQRLVALIRRETGVQFDRTMMFDVQVKRIHEYKRQLLNLLHVIHLYDRVLQDDTEDMAPRCVLIGGKAAPGYAFAKKIIKLANDIAGVINADERAQPWLRMVYLPDYNVSSMEVICPGTDLSEQISTAGKEASGTGNMKFMMNGAVTMGTLDGANVEILDAVGAENFYLFGHTAAEVNALQRDYDPCAWVAADPALARVLDMLERSHFNPREPDVARDIAAALKSPYEPWMTLADFSSFREAQIKAAKDFADVAKWGRMAMLNTACSGRFSSDRTIADYRDDIWFRDGD